MPDTDPQTELDVEQVALLLKVSELLCSSLSIQQLMDSLMDSVIAVIKAERGFVMLRNEQNAWSVRSARAIAQDSFYADDFRVSRTIVEQVSETGLPVLTTDALADARFRGHESIGLYNLKSILAVPITWGKEIRGVIYADHLMETGVFGKKERILLEGIARQAAIALENARLYEELQHVHVTSMAAAKLELEKTQEQLLHSSKMAAIGQLAAGVAHEINNPLGAIAVGVSALQGGQTDPASLPKRLNIIQKGVERCRDIVARLLTSSRRSNGEMGPCSLATLAEEALALCGKDLESRGILIVSDIVQVAPVIADAGSILQIMLNFLINARDCFKERPEAPTVWVYVKAEADSLIFRVTDNGTGMSSETQARIFEPFFTTKQVGSGTGLGLFISFQIAQRHGAEIAVESTLGKGSRFTLKFPKSAGTLGAAIQG